MSVTIQLQPLAKKFAMLKSKGFQTLVWVFDLKRSLATFVASKEIAAAIASNRWGVRRRWVRGSTIGTRKLMWIWGWSTQSEGATKGAQRHKSRSKDKTD